MQTPLTRQLTIFGVVLYKSQTCIPISPFEDKKVQKKLYQQQRLFNTGYKEQEKRH
jgi:hypothetical protein